MSFLILKPHRAGDIPADVTLDETLYQVIADGPTQVAAVQNLKQLGTPAKDLLIVSVRHAGAKVEVENQPRIKVDMGETLHRHKSKPDAG